MLNSMIYEVEFPGFQVKDYVVNAISEKIFLPVYEEGYSVTPVGSIIYYNIYDSDLYKANNYVVTRRG